MQLSHNLMDMTSNVFIRENNVSTNSARIQMTEEINIHSDSHIITTQIMSSLNSIGTLAVYHYLKPSDL